MATKVKTDKKREKEFKYRIKNKKKVLGQYLTEKLFAIQLRQSKVPNWVNYEEAYNGISKKTLITRSNLHLPVVFEGVQNMGSKLGAVPTPMFDTIPEGDENAAPIMKHIVQEDLDSCNFDLIYEQSKVEAGIYGRAIYKVIPGNDKQTVELVDTLSYLISPIAKDTKSALYQGQQFIYKTIEQLEDEAEEFQYDEEELQKLKENKVATEYQADNSPDASQKNIRMANMGLSNVNQYGSKVAEITEWYTYIKGILTVLTVVNDIYLLRAVPATELGLERPPFVSWGTYPRGITFWCPSVAGVYYESGLAIDVNGNQQIDNQTYTNFNNLLVSSRSGLKQSSINPRPLGLTVVSVAPGEKISDHVFALPIAPIGGAMATMQTIKSFADSASGLAPNMSMIGGKKISVTQQSKLNAEVEDKIKVMKRNVNNACRELFQLMADITKDRLTKPRTVKIFDYKNLTLEIVTKSNFKDVVLVAKAIDSDDSMQNKAIKQKAFLDFYAVAKDDPKFSGQTALRRELTKKFDIQPDVAESFFQAEPENPNSPKPPAAPGGGASATAGAPMAEATPILSAGGKASAAEVPNMIQPK